MNDYRPRFDSIRDIPRDLDGIDVHELIAQWRGLARLEFHQCLADVGSDTARATLSRHRGNVYELCASQLAALAGVDVNRVEPIDYLDEPWPTVTSQ